MVSTLPSNTPLCVSRLLTLSHMPFTPHISAPLFLGMATPWEFFDRRVGNEFAVRGGAKRGYCVPEAMHKITMSSVFSVLTVTLAGSPIRRQPHIRIYYLM